MKKKIISICSCLVIVLIGVILAIYNNSFSKDVVIDGIHYAVNLDGFATDSVPSKGLYQVDVTCESAEGKWLYDEWKLQVVNMSGEEVRCNLDFTTISQTNLNNHIIGLSGTTQGIGQVVEENGYRYEGKDPNNYIWFNNELWRIIGVFDESSHGQSGQNLVKIIRNGPIGGLVWDNTPSYGSNEWSTSDLKKLLNGAYLNSENGTGGEYCYGYGTSVPANCDYRESGINNTYRPMIESVTWYLGGHSTRSATAATFFTAERGTTVYSGRPTEWEGQIGLMYLSDYGYSVLASSCTRTTNLDDYSYSTICAGQSWLFTNFEEWTLTPYSRTGDMVFYIGKSSYIGTKRAFPAGDTRPVLYLDSSVYVIDGNGSQADPYIIGM